MIAPVKVQLLRIVGLSTKPHCASQSALIYGGECSKCEIPKQAEHVVNC
jgi:hypothetical protein